jgi:transposase-like protein
VIQKLEPSKWTPAQNPNTRIEELEHKIREATMNKITTEITEIKTTVSMEQWQQRIMDCQQSGMSIKAWCQENGVATSSYYHYLRKIRESMLQEKQLVPLKLPKAASSAGIRIETSGITVTLPETASAEQLTAILSALKSC